MRAVTPCTGRRPVTIPSLFVTSGSLQRLTKVLAAFALLLVVAPLVVCVVDELSAHGARGPLAGDFALLELGARQALHGRQLFGPYSRFAWHHPGPIYFYLLAPLYALAGDGERLHLGASLIALGSVILIVVHGSRLAPGPLHRAVGLVLLAAGISWLCSTDYVGGPAGPWNPAVTILPFVALLVVAGDVAMPARGGLASLVALHAFVVQTHVSHAPVATIVAATAVALRHVGGAADAPLRRRRRRGLALLVAIAAWSPTVVEAVVHRGGNLARWWAFLQTNHEVHPALRTMGYTTRRLASIVPAEHLPLMTALALVIALEVCLMLAILHARARGRRVAARFACITATVMPACFLAGLGVRAALHAYLTPAHPLVPLVVLFAIVCASAPELPAPRLALGAAAVVIAFATPRLVEDVRLIRMHASDAPPAAALDAAQLATIVASDVPSVPDADVQLRATGKEGWAVLAGVVSSLERRGVVPIVEERWRFMFEDSVRYATSGKEWILVDDVTASDEGELIFVGRVSAAFHAGAKTQLGRADVIATTGVTGDPRVLVDGDVTEGAPFDAPTSLVIDGTGSVTLALSAAEHPALVPRGLRVTADGNDEYLVEGSMDGSRFEPSGVLPTFAAWGMRTRDMTFAQNASWTYVRLRPATGDGFYSLAEVTPILGARRALRLEFGVPATRSHLTEGWSIDEADEAGPFVWAIGEQARCVVSLVPRRAYLVSLRVEPFASSGAQTMRIEVAGQTLASLQLASETASYELELPAALVSEQTELVFRFGHAVAPRDVVPHSDDARALAVAFRELTFLLK